MKLYTGKRRVAALIVLSSVFPFQLRANPISGWRTTALGSAGKDIKRPRGSESACGECPAVASNQHNKHAPVKQGSRRTAALPCHPPGYVDPRLARDFNAALREMKRAGIQPKITSTWRSSGDQNKMYQCSMSSRCRVSHPGLYRALPPGQSVHEAGFAVDLSGIATGPRGAKHLTAQGRRIVQIMEGHGFRWRYGLMDPVHFEADPKEHGYVSLRQAILVNQTRCQAAVAQQRRARQNGERATARTIARGNGARGEIAARQSGERVETRTVTDRGSNVGTRTVASRKGESTGLPVKQGGERSRTQTVTDRNSKVGTRTVALRKGERTGLVERQSGERAGTRTIAGRGSNKAETRTVAKRTRNGVGTRTVAKQNHEKAGSRIATRQQTAVKVAQRKTPREHKRLPSA